MTITDRDRQYMSMAKTASNMARCLKKQLGCYLVTNNGKNFMGYNGPSEFLSTCKICCKADKPGIEHGYLCRAVHAERKCLLLAAKEGVSTNDSTLYTYMGVPCKDCLLELIDAGVERIVALNNFYYDDLSKGILAEWVNNGGVFEVCEVEKFYPHGRD